MRALPREGLGPQVFARMTGVPPSRLRYYADHGLLVPAEVDPRTGRRRYRPRQVADGRLLHALVITGMPVRRAAAVVADADRPAVLAHLAAAHEALAVAADHLPAPGPDQVQVATRCRDCWVLEVPVTPGPGLLDQVRTARAALAARLGVPVAELPRWRGAGGLPDGPRVQLRSTDAGPVPAALLLPWPDEAQPAPDEHLVATGSGSWAVADAGPAEAGLADAVPADAPVAAEDAQHLLQAFLDGPDGGFPVERHLVLDAALVRAGLAVAFSPW